MESICYLSQYDAQKFKDIFGNLRTAKTKSTNLKKSKKGYLNICSSWFMWDLRVTSYQAKNLGLKITTTCFSPIELLKLIQLVYVTGKTFVKRKISASLQRSF